MKLQKYFFGLCLIALIFFSTNQSLADEGIGYQEQNGLVTLTVDDLTIMVNAGGQVPKFHYQLESGLSFNIMFKLMAEYYDFNEDGVFQFNEINVWGNNTPAPGEIRYSTILALPSVVWEFSGFVPEEVDETIVAVHFNFTSTSILDPFYSDLELAIVAHLYLNDQIIDGYEIEGGRELKFDLNVRNWPWQKDDTNLAIRFDISSDNTDDELEQEPGIPVDTGSNTTGEEQKAIHTENEVKQEVTIRHGDVEGYFAYANQSQNRINNEYVDEIVTASYCTDGENTLQYYLSFEHFDDELIYDPSIGSLSVDTEDTEDTVAAGSSNLVFLSLSALFLTTTYIYRKKKN